MKKTICFIGGDNRNIALSELLSEKGFAVKTYDGSINIKDFIKDAEYIICGIPFSRDGKTINAPNLQEVVNIEDIIINMSGEQKLIAGSISEKVKNVFKDYEVKFYDFLDDEDFAVYNTIPTAEGAIEVAMNKTDKTINSSKCLILGYGRIGKVLSDLLNGLHAKVTVAARKNEDFAWIETMGYDYITYPKLKDSLKNYDIIFNTVPKLVLGKDELNSMRKDVLIVDLASKPGGVDFEFAKEIGIKAELALGLPGKVAPRSVAKYMLNKIIG